MGWMKQSEDTKIPEWLKQNIPLYCECGSEFVNYTNMYGKYTGRRCSNPTCPYTMAAKVVGMCKLLGIKGIGEGNALKIVRRNNLQSHIDAMPYLVKGKPKVMLPKLLQLCLIEDMDKKWNSIPSKYETVQKFLAEYNGPFAEIIAQNSTDIEKMGEYVELVQEVQMANEPLITGNIMLSGEIDNLAHREDYAYLIYKHSNGLIKLNVVGKRKTNVMALIQEPNSKVHQKAMIAKENGIPIYSPIEFMQILNEMLKKKLEEGNK